MSHSIIKLPRVKGLTSLSRSAIYAKVANGEFPRPIKLGERAVGWIESEINDWITARAAERGGAS